MPDERTPPAIENRNGTLLGIAAAFGAGICLAIQARVNGRLGSSTPTPILAAVVSFGVGFITLALAALIPSLRAGIVRLTSAVRTQRLKWWECVGGAIGGLFVAVQTSVVGALGVALFTVIVVGAQTVSSMAVDHSGIGPRGAVKITPIRVVAGIIAVIGVTLTALGRSSGGVHFAFGAALLTFAVAALMQLQQALNGRVTKAVASPYATTLQNFVVGLITLFVIVGIEAALGTRGFTWPHHTPWWAWLGGLLGVGLIGLTAWATKYVSVLVLGLMSLIGQLLTATVLDLANASTRHLVTAQVIIGMLVTALGAIAAAFSARLTRRR